MSEPLKIVFAGTPDFAASSLQALLDSRHEVIGVYTQPERPAGRGRTLTASPVKQLALQHSIPVYQPQTLKQPEDQQTLAALKPDLMVVVAYGLLLPQAVLDIPRLGCINVHASLLPRWRGAAPIHRAMLAGDSETGVTIMQMDAGLDTGAMLYKTHCPINPDETSGQLHDKLAQQGAEALVSCLDLIQQGTVVAEVQNDAEACYAEKLSKQEGQLNWSSSAAELDRKIRGLCPWPVAFFQYQEQTIRVWQAQPLTDQTGIPGKILAADKSGIVVACGEGALRLQQLQLPGKKPMAVADILNARQDSFAPGLQLI
ncbi:methionyl-tRNA formyltransferase [Neptuniibacter sp. CAU 1671]|uniref:methionyl-tRNA formyltransferase n=1 Tax=Neptuniibacter sp. CAU 1671 TaxID=3032593 RepID=UPI0023D9E99C|nr:methionyl-tRNA formyltransferase [Neptuniibacter sp. CAU 1671]MDF2182499.1 methionyl-tRNA formyltransferase [Neptuniibacter sp. CAU 1671]